jgi:hypothetical protein
MAQPVVEILVPVDVPLARAPAGPMKSGNGSKCRVEWVTPPGTSASWRSYSAPERGFASAYAPAIEAPDVED